MNIISSLKSFFGFKPKNTDTETAANKTNYITVNVTLDKAQDNYHSFSAEERASIVKDHPGYESAASDPIKFYNLIVSANIEPRA